MRAPREAGISEMISECAYETELGVEIGRSGSKNQYEKVSTPFQNNEISPQTSHFSEKMLKIVEVDPDRVESGSARADQP